jgi:16S rRNA processing protein RimM
VAPSRESGRGDDRIVLGRITGPFGVRGWVKIASFTEPPEQILDFARWRADLADGTWRELRPAEGRRHGKGLVARIEGVDDRDAAVALANPELWVERRDLPALEEGQIYRADLIGLEVINLEGETLGRIDHFLDLPANPVMVVVGERERWLPLGKDRMMRVDLAGGRVTVDWDAAF